MDLSLWDPPDDQGHPAPSSENQSGGNNTEDNWKYYSSLGYGRDMMEEDVLNEKSCVQVLRKLIDKADEEIIKLEEDIVMLQCQLAWVDEDWSKPCSAALEKEIDNLDTVIQIKKEITELHFNVQVEPHRLHDVVKPLLESYFLVKSKQVELTKIQNLRSMDIDPIQRTSTRNKEILNNAEKRTSLLEDNERKSPSMEPKETETMDPEQVI